MSYIVQGSGPWFAQRVGKLTASRLHDAIDRLADKTDKKTGVITLGGYKATREALLKELLAERMTGAAVPHFTSNSMKHGTENEPVAKDEYEEMTGEILMPCGFYDHPTIENFGATPDALRGRDGIVEIKAPNTSTHLEYIMDGKIPLKYQRQILAQLACTRRTEALFISFDPRIPGKNRWFIKEWTPLKEEVEAVEDEARKFLKELEGMWDLLCAEAA